MPCDGCLELPVPDSQKKFFAAYFNLLAFFLLRSIEAANQAHPATLTQISGACSASKTRQGWRAGLALECGSMNPAIIAAGTVWYVVFLFSLTCHEAAHALVAKLGGDPTAARGGQVSLNPIPHIRREPFGTVLMPILSFALGGWMIGWGSAPYDPVWQQRHPHRAAWMALAGPLANLGLVAVAALGIRVCLAMGILAPPKTVRFSQVVGSAQVGGLEGLALLLSVLFSLNLLLATFNLLPLPPLDGNTAVGLFLPEQGGRRFAELTRQPTLALLGLLICWKFFHYVFRPVFSLALDLLYFGLTWRG